MGLGGYLTWTAVGREIYNRTGLKSLPLEQHGNTVKLIKSEIFYNNPYFEQSFTGEPCFPLQLNNPATNYCLNDLPDRAIHKKDSHIINTACSFYGINDPLLKCEIFLDNNEKKEVQELLKGLPDNFITIEPYSNSDYTVNRMYPFKKWQEVVDSIKNEINVVQIGSSPKMLENVIDLRGKTTFRTVGGIIEKSKILLSTEGGLTHLATAFNTPAFVILTGYQTLEMIRYAQNFYFNIASHGPCGLKIKCPQCQADAFNHDSKDISVRVREVLKRI